MTRKEIMLNHSTVSFYHDFFKEDFLHVDSSWMSVSPTRKVTEHFTYIHIYINNAHCSLAAGLISTEVGTSTLSLGIFMLRSLAMPGKFIIYIKCVL